AVRVVEALPAEHILFVPDRNLAAYVQSKTRKTIVAWDGNCYVHHQITPEQIAAVRARLPHVRVLAHPECRADVLALADAVLSTSGMVRYAKESAEREFLVVTECGLSDRLLLEVPGKRFYKSCKLCHYMKMITLEGTRDALRDLAPEIVVPEDIRQRAARALERMLELGGWGGGPRRRRARAGGGRRRRRVHGARRSAPRAPGPRPLRGVRGTVRAPGRPCRGRGDARGRRAATSRRPDRRARDLSRAAL